MKILMIIGTRPEAIKMLPLALEIRKHQEFELEICHSGQHREMAREVFELFKIEPDHTFDAMREGQSLMELTTRLLNYFDMLFMKTKPEIVLVHGDTTSAFCASLAAFYRGIRVAHIEAGLRTHNVSEPFPEEFNRVCIDCTADLCFAPTALAVKNLESEGRNDAILVGNTVIDALKYTISNKYFSPFLDMAGGRKIILITAHRRENLGEKMRSALLGVRDILLSGDDLFAIFPAHPNPAVRGVADEVFKNIKNIKICPPLPLRDFHNILSRSHVVLTDSGGIQEEATSLGIPTFLMRDATERSEGVESGNIRLVGTNRDEVASAVIGALGESDILDKMRVPSAVFGDGHSCEKIVKKLLSLA